jgi:hypothetical protein
MVYAYDDHPGNNQEYDEDNDPDEEARLQSYEQLTSILSKALDPASQEYQRAMEIIHSLGGMGGAEDNGPEPFAGRPKTGGDQDPLEPYVSLKTGRDDPENTNRGGDQDGRRAHDRRIALDSFGNKIEPFAEMSGREAAEYERLFGVGLTRRSY